LWAVYGTDDAGASAYRQLLAQAASDMNRIGGGQLRLKNDLPLFEVLDRLVLSMALAPTMRSGRPPQRMAS
jgi:hypothetical protein